MLQIKFTRAAGEEYCDVRRKEKRIQRKKKKNYYYKNHLNDYKNVILQMTVGSSTRK
jgi:hypothetical protein